VVKFSHTVVSQFVKVKTALEDFLDWVQKFLNVVIVAHNGRTFDFRVLCNALDHCGLQQTFCSTVSAFCDSLALIRQIHPKLGKYTQEFLAQYFCGDSYIAYNAAADVAMLDKIMEAAHACIRDYKRHSYNVDCHFL
jgi:DNA polymerase III alpha subunit (gram-positive type)